MLKTEKVYFSSDKYNIHKLEQKPHNLTSYNHPFNKFLHTAHSKDLGYIAINKKAPVPEGLFLEVSEFIIVKAQPNSQLNRADF